ncbi:MAG TPA: hypothetical protein VFH48_30795 [Chloroflexota bacterium]|nr:hypothetical protein [Chloroflexota bacterium]
MARRSTGRARAFEDLALVIALIAGGAAIWLNVQRISTLGLDDSPPVWVIDAIPPVLSAQFFGHPIRYTSLSTVSDSFYEGLKNRPREAGEIDAVIDEIARLDPAQLDTGYRLLGPEDKGIVDFVAAAFWIFGQKTRAITWLYLIVVLASALALLAAARRSLPIIAWLVAFLLAHALLMPMVAFNPQLGSYLALRAVPVMSMIACFHLLVYLLQPSVRPVDVTLVAFQALLIVFTVHLRTTAQWQVVIVVLVTLVAITVRTYRDRHPSIVEALSRQASTAIPLSMLAIGLLGLQLYRALAYPVEYQRGDQILTRGFWHNIVSGLAFHPTFAEREQLRIDDVSIMRAVGRNLIAQGRDDDWVAMGGETPNMAGLRWVPYELAARQFLMQVCRGEPDVCLSNAFYYKPRSLVGLLAWSSGLREVPPDLTQFVSRDGGGAVRGQMLALNDRLRAEHAFAEPWRVEGLLIGGLLTVALALAPRRDAVLILTAGLALAFGSLLTTVIGYPAPWTIVDPAIAIASVLYLSCGLGLAFIARRLTRRWRARAASSTTIW